MNFNSADIVRYIKMPDPKIKCVVVFGTNEGMISDYVRQFAQTVCRDLNDAFQTATLDMETIEKDIGVLYGEYNARSLTGQRRVVMIKDGNNNLTSHLKTMFKDSKSDTLVVISSTSLNKKSSLAVLAADSPDFAAVACYDDRESGIAVFARDYFIKKGITVSKDAMEILCKRLSNDRKASLNELDKLVTYLGTRRNITPEDVYAAVSDTSESSFEDLCYFVACGETDKAMDAYGELIRQGTEPSAVISSLIYHFMQLTECIAKIEKGENPRSFIKPLHVIFFRESDFLMQFQIWKRQSVLNVLALLYRAGRDCRTTDYPAEEIVSYTIMQISGAARKLRQHNR